MVTFDSARLGLSFSYPRILGDVELMLVPGESGYAFYGLFTRYDALTFEGRSHDFSEGRGGLLGDTIGFARDADGSYLMLSIPDPDGSPIAVDQVLEVDGEEILLVSPGFTGSDRGDIQGRAALVNLSGDEFPGMIVVNRDELRLPKETFLALLDSIRVAEPEEGQ
jgi:hypothetical protein